MLLAGTCKEGMMGEVRADLIRALKHELRERTGNGKATGECEVCGGDSGKVGYHGSCCKGSRRALAMAEKGKV